MKYLLAYPLLLAAFFASFRLFKIADNYLMTSVFLVSYFAAILLVLILSLYKQKAKKLISFGSAGICVFLSLSLLSYTGYSYSGTDSLSSYPTIQLGDTTVSRHFDIKIERYRFVGLQSDRYGALQKRVVAIPGDEVLLCDEQVIINNTLYLPPHLKSVASKSTTPCTYKEEKITLKDNEYYVLGDNMQDSADSRMFGPVKREQIFSLSLYKVSPEGKVTYL